jgi:two-component system phosphate regulon response regulator OmpR
MANILVADDDPGIRRMIQRLLEQEGYNVRTAADGAQAWKQLQSERHDLLVLDLNMPVMSGWEVYDRIEKAGLRLPIVVITAGETVERVQRDLNGAEVLGKPFELTELLDCVAANLASQSASPLSHPCFGRATVSR